MPCSCKNNQKRRALTLLNGRSWGQLNDIEQGQIESLYHQQFKKYGTEEEILNWLK